MQTVKPLAGQALPEHDAVDGAVVMGGPMNVDEVERFPALAAEREWLAEAVERGCRCWGYASARSCWRGRWGRR